ncbi:YuzB family protein [Paenibacillus sp. N1-5-1-14]|uniref:YuzB family protein n=1 Tax=Paenibacillus radicibacter TaxID=2972488 RepID=UPI0021597E04|nr:YuzB family protein [Paenibacillus radicibacter]MCR8643855.1 YuzB family protein [Paenibacillus radicibacter]
MANDIRVCDKCKHMSMKSILPKIKAIAPDAEVKVGCKSYCGPCSRFAFIFINGRYVTGKTEDEAIEKARKYVKK